MTVSTFSLAVIDVLGRLWGSSGLVLEQTYVHLGSCGLGGASSPMREDGSCRLLDSHSRACTLVVV